jgi:ABC-type dipeptide/oligopeptide/nickel transport system permease component
MASYVIRRLLQALLVILIVSVLIFIIIRLLPGDPIEMLVAQNINAEEPAPMVAQIKHEWAWTIDDCSILYVARRRHTRRSCLSILYRYVSSQQIATGSL